MSYKQEYFVENIKINNINKRKNNYILEHKKKFVRFRFESRIDSVIEKLNKNNKADVYITFYSPKEDLTLNYYLRCSKPMIENQMLKILKTNPLLIKSLGAYLKPIALVEFIIFNYWVYIYKKKLVHDYNWYESQPKHHSQELLEIMRSF